MTVEDESSFGHVALYRDLKRVLEVTRHVFRVPTGDAATMSYNRTSFLNLTYFGGNEPVDIWCDRHVPADVVAHAAWHRAGHEAARRAGSASPGWELLTESIASAFDIYLVGRLLGHAAESDFLTSQVPAMREAAEEEGCSDDAFEAMLAEAAEDPEGAFEKLRALLFETASGLIVAEDADAALAQLERAGERPFGPLLHHYELSTWLLHARLQGGTADDAPAHRLDEQLRSAGRTSLEMLEREWLSPLLPASH